MTRHPDIRKLFESFDARASNEGYTPAAWDDELARLKDALAGGATLDKDRLHVNRVALASTIGIDVGRLGLPRYDSLISAKDREILNQAMSSRIDPFLHDRVHAFSDLMPIWPRAFLERVGIRFKQVLAAYAPDTTKQQHLRMLSLLSWIGTNDHASCRAVLSEARQHNRVLSEDHWEDAVFAWRDTVVATVAAGRRAHGGADAIIATMRSVLGHMASGRILPALSDLPGIKRAARRVRHLDSLVELAPSAETGRETIEFARRVLTETASRIGVETGRDDQKFLASIQVNDNDDPAETVRALLQLRLDAVRNRAASIMSAARSDFKLGCDLLKSANVDPAAFMRSYRDRSISDHRRQLLVGEFFPPATSEENLAIGRGNLLALIQADQGGIPPPADGPDGQFFGKRYNAYGRKSMFERLLGVHRDAAAAALTLYLVDSGANISVGRTLDADALENSDLAGHRRITGIKSRAQGKPIVIDLPEDGQAIRALEWLQARLAPLAARASPEDVDRLMLTVVGTRIGLMEPWWFTGWFKNFASDLPCLAGIDATPNMLRPSVLLHAALSNDGRLAVGMAIGQHGLAVTQGYQEKHPVRLIYDEHVRRFQTAFETLVLAAVPEAAALLGVDDEVLAERLKALRPTGLGTFCAAPSDQGSPCSSVDCWNDCPHLAIVAEVEAIATLRLWQASLRECAADWERDRPERWEACWLPWLCLVDAVEHRMSRGTLLPIWNRAGRRADEIAATAGYTPPKPW